MQISSQFTPEVILGSDSLYCEGVMKTVTAEGIHGGSDPAYQWILNGMPAGSDTSSFSWIPSPGDSIRCIFTSSLTCVTVNPVTSRVVVINPDLSHPAGVSLSAIPYPSCPGEPVTVTATPLNGGSGPSMAWYVNGIATGNNSPQFSFIPGDGDAVTCIMTSTLG